MLKKKPSQYLIFEAVFYFHSIFRIVSYFFKKDKKYHLAAIFHSQ